MKGGLSYQKKLMLCSMAVGMIPILILCVLYMIVSTMQISRNMRQDLEQTSARMAEEIKSELDSMTRTMKWVLSDETVYDALSDSPGKLKSDEIMDYRYMKQTFENYQDYQKVFRVRVMLKEDTVYQNDNRNFFPMDYWEPEGMLSSGGWLAGYDFPYPYEGSETLVSLYNTIYSYRSGEITSVIYIDQKESRLCEIYQNIVRYGDGVRAMIVSEDGRIISSVDKDVIGRTVHEQYGLTDSLLTAGISSDAETMVSMAQIGETDLYILEIASKGIMREQTGRVIFLAALVGVIAAGIAWVISVRVANSLSRRLLMLTTAIDGQRECPVREPVAGPGKYWDNHGKVAVSLIKDKSISLKKDEYKSDSQAANEYKPDSQTCRERGSVRHNSNKQKEVSHDKDRTVPQDEVDIVISAYNRMILDEKRMRQEVYEAKLKEEHMKLMALQSQISPHFLYNILAGIKGAVELERYGEATEMISDLARFFQLVLSRGDEKITISDETEMIRKYVLLQSKVYAGQFTWEMEIDGDIRPFLITKFTLQPLVENAIRHGIRCKKGAGRLKITGGFEDESIVIRVMDDGAGISPERLEALEKSLAAEGGGKSTGYGLRNVDARLKLHFGSKYGIFIKSKQEQGTTVSVRIPLEVSI